MPKLLDLTGQRFDKLVVLEQAPSRKRHVMWKCRCDCGNECEVSGEFLRNVHHSSLPRDCGCSKIKNIKKIKTEERIKTQNNRLVGQRFGKLVVKKATDKRQFGSIVWECECDCGNIKYVPTNSLISGHTQSCGCLVREIQGNDLTGQKFGKLTVLFPCNYKRNSSILWHCKCDCGNECDVESYSLRSGNTKSCGCISSSIGELLIESLLLENNINYKKEQAFPDFKTPNNGYYRYDFSIIEDNHIIRLIEFDGIQHYSTCTGVWGDEKTDPLEKRQQRDKEKNEYALSHGIPLVRIPYWERDNITLDMLMGDEYLVHIP